MYRYDSLIQKVSLIIFSFVLAFYSESFVPVLAQTRIEIPSSPNPVGSGARALGMGGAFIAIADDATAASWNPAGLTQLDRPEISFTGVVFHRIEDNTFGIHPESSGAQSISDSDINYLSIVYPFSFFGYNTTISISYQNLYDFTREWNFSIQDSNEFYTQNVDYDYNLDGSLSALAVAYSIRINPRFSFGFTLNFWEDGLCKNEWEDRRFERGFVTVNDESEIYSFESHSVDRYSFNGFNANLGIMWDYNSRLSIGAVFKTPFKADLKHEHSSAILQPGYYPIINSRSFTEYAKMDMPMSYGVGFAYRFSDEFTVSLDVYRTEWGDFILTNSKGEEISPITGRSPAESDVDSTHQLRMGVEYLFIISKYLIPLQYGIFYDPAPAEGSPDDYFGFSFGSGIGNGKNFFFNIAYQYRFGNNIGTSILENWNFSQDMEEHTVYSSVDIFF